MIKCAARSWRDWGGQDSNPYIILIVWDTSLHLWEQMQCDQHGFQYSGFTCAFNKWMYFMVALTFCFRLKVRFQPRITRSGTGGGGGGVDTDLRRSTGADCLEGFCLPFFGNISKRDPF